MKKSKIVIKIILIICCVCFILPLKANAVTLNNNLRFGDEDIVGEGYSWDASASTLTLENANLENNVFYSCDSFMTLGDATIVLIGENKISNVELGIVCGKLTIKGSGTLTIQCKDHNVADMVSHIQGNELIMESGTLILESLSDTEERHGGINCNSITINGNSCLNYEVPSGMFWCDVTISGGTCIVNGDDRNATDSGIRGSVLIDSGRLSIAGFNYGIQLSDNDKFIYKNGTLDVEGKKAAVLAIADASEKTENDVQNCFEICNLPDDYEIGTCTQNYEYEDEDGLFSWNEIYATLVPRGETLNMVSDKEDSSAFELLNAVKSFQINGKSEDHVHSYNSSVVEPTCTEKGYTIYICSACGDEYKDNYTDAVGHRWDSGKVTKTATCGAAGVKTYTCSRCKITKTETVPATGNHNYKQIGITKATTSKNGAVKQKCSVCGKTASQVIYRPKTVTLSATSYTYNNKVKRPTVMVKDSAGKTILNSNYTVSYASGRKNVGSYKVTVKFKSTSTKYSGTLSATFKIIPKSTILKSVTATSNSFTAKWIKLTTQTTGYQLQYSTNSKFTGAKILSIASNKTTSWKVTKLTAKKKYYVRIRTYKKVSGKKYYSSWSKVKTVTTKK